MNEVRRGRIALTLRAQRPGAGTGGHGNWAWSGENGVINCDRQNAAPEKASRGTEPLDSGACAATNVAMRDAVARMVPSCSRRDPKSASAHLVQRWSDRQRVADVAPKTFAMLTRVRVKAALSR